MAALGMVFRLKNAVGEEGCESDLILEIIEGTANSTTAYIYGAGVVTPANALGTGSYQLKHIKTIHSAMINQTSATFTSIGWVKSSEEMQDDLLTLTLGNGDTFTAWVIGWGYASY